LKAKKKGMLFMIVLTVILLIILVSISKMYVEMKGECNMQKIKGQELEETLMYLQDNDIQELISNAESVLRGDVIIEDETNPLWRYSFKENKYPTVTAIDLELHVIYIHIDGDNGLIKVAYDINYLSSSGYIVWGAGHIIYPAEWTIEKHEGKWVIVKIVERGA